MKMEKKLIRSIFHRLASMIFTVFEPRLLSGWAMDEDNRTHCEHCYTRLVMCASIYFLKLVLMNVIL